MSKYILAEMTWPEAREAAGENRVAVIPVGTIEDHGCHLPLDTDVVLCTEVARRGCALVPEHVVLVPSINHGFSPHHMDFPGTISIDGETFTRYVMDVTRSLAHHGFQRMIILNGHGSNRPFLQTVARLTTVETPAFCVAVSHWDLVPLKEVATQLREGPVPGSMAHACELETSMYLAIRPELVQMDKAVDEVFRTTSDYFWGDLISSGGRRSSAGWMEWWSALTASGALGTPTLASRAKGEQMLTAAARGLADLVLEVKNWERRPRVDHHLRQDSHAA